MSCYLGLDQFPTRLLAQQLEQQMREEEASMNSLVDEVLNCSSGGHNSADEGEQEELNERQQEQRQEANKMSDEEGGKRS